MGVAEEGLDAELGFELMVEGELGAVVEGDGLAQFAGQGFKPAADLVGGGLSGFIGLLGEEEDTRLALVSRQEPDHRCEFLGMLGQEGRGLDRFGTHRSSPPIRTKRNYFRNVRILPHMAARVHHFSQKARLAVRSTCERICERNAAQRPRWCGTQRDGIDGVIPPDLHV